MGCRKNIYSLTPTQLQKFVNALNTLKANGTYDTFVERHNVAMHHASTLNNDPCGFTQRNMAHRGPSFGPWHRFFLRDLELALQAIDPTISLPYWDWAQDSTLANPSTAPLWTDAYIGGDGDPMNSNLVPNGPFKDWVALVASGGGLVKRGFKGIVRMLGRDPNGFPTLPGPAEVTSSMNSQNAYDSSPWCESSATTPSFRNRLEGWLSLQNEPQGEPRMHNRVHTWVGGDMQPGTSPNDPVFFLHHCNVDRLWALWQAANPGLPYVPNGGGPPGHNLMDQMNDLGTPGITPASTLDHHAMGYWYDTDPPQVSLVTPSIDFGGVPEGIGGTGVTTYRAIKFDVQSCSDVTLQITAGPTGGFAAPSLSTVVPEDHPPLPGLLPNQGRLWISYTSTAPGDMANGTVTVQAVDSGTNTTFGPWVVNLAAHTVARPKSAVVLVLDRSGSMAIDAGNGTSRVDLLRTAVSTFVDVMQQGDGLGIVRFDNLVDTLMPVTDVGPIPVVPGSGRDLAQQIVASHNPANTIDPRGSTSIGGGIQQAKMALDNAPQVYTVRATVVLTDGLENTPPMIADVGASLTAQTFAIGFGQAASISTAALNAITQNHGGYLVVTGPITQDETFALTEYFLKIQAGVNNSTAVLDPRGELVPGVTHKIPFLLTQADMGVDVILISRAPYYIDFRLQAPDGTIITPATTAGEPAIRFVSTPRVSYYRASLPMLKKDPAGSRGGQWYALLSLGDAARGGDKGLVSNLGSRSLSYSLLVHAYSNLTFTPSLTQVSFEPGAQVQVRAALDQYDVPLGTRPTVWAEIRLPDGTNNMVMLQEEPAGRFQASFAAAATGVYVVLIRARGVTMEGQSFEREQKLTAVVFPGGDQPVPRGGDDRWCRLVRCLFGDKQLGPEIAKSLEAKGISPSAFEGCLRTLCLPPASSLGGEHPYVAAGGAAPPVQPSAVPGQNIASPIFSPTIAGAVNAGAAAYSMRGTFYEACDCNPVCPCWIGDPPDGGQCTGVFAWEIEEGSIDGVDVAGLKTVSVSQHQGPREEGGQRVMIFVDEAATRQQADALAAAFSGRLGGPLQEFGDLLGELLGVERAPITLRREGRLTTLTVDRRIRVEGTTNEGPSGRPMTLNDGKLSTVLGTPAEIGESGRFAVKLAAQGMNIDVRGRSTTSGRFSYENAGGDTSNVPASGPASGGMQMG
jgi:hypothetical protein